ncbi:MAG: DJ-1/PfpI family protein [Bacteroidales bacterium]|nr:DJ-1/PfpI family protein [Bacteroidales bacterium]
MKKILLILAPGFEELEAVGAADILRRAGFELRTAGLYEQNVVGSHGLPISADLRLDDVIDQDFDAVVLPGGLPGATNLCNSDAVIELMRRTVRNGGIAAAICAAPIVLARAGLLANRRFTMYPGFERYLNGATPTGNDAETDGPIVTGKGPGAVFAFASAVAASLGTDVSELYRGMMISR